MYSAAEKIVLPKPKMSKTFLSGKKVFLQDIHDGCVWFQLRLGPEEYFGPFPVPLAKVFNSTKIKQVEPAGRFLSWILAHEKNTLDK